MSKPKIIAFDKLVDRYSDKRVIISIVPSGYTINTWSSYIYLELIKSFDKRNIITVFLGSDETFVAFDLSKLNNDQLLQVNQWVILHKETVPIYWLDDFLNSYLVQPYY